jgi:AcrR family transcriptional regulator
MTPRLTPSARRDLIIAAAIPLFARKGFAGTTTREIAEAAGVSEALVFKHFANKTALYDAIVQNFHEARPTFEGLRALPSSTHSLVRIVRVTTAYFSTLMNDSDVARARYRMYLRSLSEDGVFAAIALEAYAVEVQDAFTQSFNAARAAGHLVVSAPNAAAAFWMMVRHHLMLSSNAMLPREVAPELVPAESVGFILRGIGLTAAAVEEIGAADLDAGDLLTWDRRTASGESAAL